MTEYVELHSYSHYSLLTGTSSPEMLVQAAAALGMKALALTDQAAVYGAVEFVTACQQYSLQPILGAELKLDTGTNLTLLVESAAGWHNLNRLVTQARHNAPKGQACLPLTSLEGQTAGLIALAHIIPDESGAGLVRTYRTLFSPHRFWLELHHHLLPEDRARIAAQVALAEHLGVGYVATNHVHYAYPDDSRLGDVLIAIRQLCTLDEVVTQLPANTEYGLKSGQEMAHLFADYPLALHNTLKIAKRCHFTFRAGLQTLPVFPTPKRMSTVVYLRQLCRTGWRAAETQVPVVLKQLEHELAIIERCGLANYFLIVWDIVRFAREHGIRCQGRGSAANSLVAYLLGISPVNPLEHDLVFERFLSDERALVPDIDIDFDAARREEVIQYLYQRYGRDHAAMACTFVTFQARSAIRDVGKAFGLPPEILDQLADAVDRRDGHEGDLHRLLPEPTLTLLQDLSSQIDGLPRHLGIHNGGMIITGESLSHYVATEPATMVDRSVVQWDKDSLETIGMVKIDILGLRMLSALSEAVAIIGEATGHTPDLDDLTFDDPAIYRLLAQADTVGVFQVESRAQAQMLPRFRPTCFADLIVAISLIRPGPIQGDMVHPYLRRRLGQEAVSYFHPLLEPALQETLGVILFQEQVLKVARDLAGFTPGQGELLRRALGSKRATEQIASLRADFIRGALAKGVTSEIAEDVFSRLQAFGGYSFPKSHAAAFAVIVYQSAWLKVYYPQAFYAALLNNQPMGFWSPAVVVHDAQRHGIPVQPVDVHQSQTRCIVTGQAIRLGFNAVKGFGEATCERLLAARFERPFRDLTDLCRRTRLPRRLIEHLILAGALESWSANRRGLLWELGGLHYAENTLDLVFEEEAVELPQQTTAEILGQEYQMIGMTLLDHPLALHRAQLQKRGFLHSAGLDSHTTTGQVKVAGLTVMHQAPPTAKGFHFLTLEDECGFINVIIRPQVYARYREVIRGAVLLQVAGQLEHEGGVTNLLAAGFKRFE